MSTRLSETLSIQATFTNVRARLNMRMRSSFLPANINHLRCCKINFLAPIICDVAKSISWRKIWDLMHALDGGVRGTKLMQTLFKVMSTPLFGPQCCILWRTLDQSQSFLDHTGESHLNMRTEAMIHSPDELFVVAARVLSFLFLCMPFSDHT